MLTYTTDRSTNAFAALETQLRALGATGERLAEATTALRNSARIFAAASARVAGRAVRDPGSERAGARPRLKLV